MTLPNAINDREYQKFVDLSPGETAVRVAIVSGGGGGSSDVNIISSVPLDVNVLSQPEPLDVNVVSFPEPLDVNVISVENIRQRILKSADLNRVATFADFGTRNQRITRFVYSTSSETNSLQRDFSYTLVGNKYRFDGDAWTVI